MIIAKYRQVSSGCLVGFFNIEFETKWGVQYVNDLKLFTKSGHSWIGFPDRQYQDDKGDIKYFPYLGFKTKDATQRFQDEIMQALADFTQNEGLMPNQPKPSKIVQYKDDDDLECSF